MSRSLMGQVKRKDYSQDDSEQGGAIPPPPKFCQVRGCSNESSAVMVRVTSGRGIQYKPASDVMNINRVHGHLAMTMNGDYQFSGWFARCPECYRDALERGKAKLRASGESRLYV